MGIRLPLTTVLSYDDVGEIGVGSTLGGKSKTFTIPQDTDNIVMKLTASLVGGSVSGTLQTTDDGGTTWYDIARTQNVGVNNNGTAVWTSAPVIGMGIRSTAPASASTVAGVTFTSILQSTGSAAASSLGAGQVSGLPVLSQTARVFLIYTGTTIVTNDKTLIQVKVNSKSGTL